LGEKVIHYPEYWGGKKLAHPFVPAEQGKFSRSVVVGNLVFVSGCQGANDETMRVETSNFAQQMRNALFKVKRALEEAGSSMDNVVKTLILIKNGEDYPTMRRTELEFYLEHAPFLVENPPASTIACVDLGKPEYLVEIEVTGVLSRE
jgi:2-iminobutanoate/2-iminopropanoate deaminase